MKRQPTRKSDSSSDRAGHRDQNGDRRQGTDRRDVDDIFYVWYPGYDAREGERRQS